MLQSTPELKYTVYFNLRVKYIFHKQRCTLYYVHLRYTFLQLYYQIKCLFSVKLQTQIRFETPKRYNSLVFFLT